MCQFHGLGLSNTTSLLCITFTTIVNNEYIFGTLSETKYLRHNVQTQKTVLYMFHWVIESPSLSKTMSLLCIKTTILYVFHNHRLGLFCVCYTDQACPTLCRYCAVHHDYYSASVSKTALCIVTVHHDYYSVSVSQTGLFIVTACASELQFCISHRLACSLLLCIIITLLYLFHRLACSLLLCIIRLFCVCFTEW